MTEGCFVFRHELVDLDGPWPPTRVTGDLLRTYYSRLGEMEGRTWNEAIRSTNTRKGRGGGGMVGAVKAIPVGDLCAAAQDRLAELRQDDRDELWEIRITSEARLWGIREGDRFYLLWWDPEHEVCPSSR